jgi:Tfp pilus assembly protein PilV
MELMIALMILSIGVLGIWSMQIAAIKGNFVSRKLTEGVVAGSDQLEKLMLMEYGGGDLAYDSTIHTPLAYDAGGNVVSWQTSSTDDEYSVQMTISEDTPVDNIKKIDVAISWERAGETKGLTYVYYKGYFTNPDAS